MASKNRLAVSLASVVAVGAMAGLAEAQDRPAVETTSVESPRPQPADAAQAPDDASAPHDLLGQAFENESAGISLRLPAGCQRVASSGAGDDLGQFADRKNNWTLKITRILRDQPTSIVNGKDNFGKPVPGLLDQTVAKLKQELSGCRILRQDLTNTRDGRKETSNVGMVAVRYTAGGSHFLAQQAIIQADDRLFYLLSLTSPGNESNDDNAPVDPRERLAVETFGQMLDSVRLLDTHEIARDQRDRLVHTRAVMLSWTSARLHSVLVPEQWLRVIHDGRDVGYSYITEETAAGVPRPLKPDELKAGKSDRDLVQPGKGILVGVRARAITSPGPTNGIDKKRQPIQIDSATWFWSAPDRHLEDWSRITLVNDGTVDKDGNLVTRHSEEFGNSERRSRMMLDKDALPGAPGDPKQPAVHFAEEATLQVTTINGAGAADPFTAQPPPWYLPQAFSHLLPRLLPLDQPKKYLFATYVPDAHAVMLRYLDVGREQRVTFAGKQVRAVPISDRIGWHGSVTTHYLSPDGTYLGSENKESRILILPTDAQTLLSIWKNPNLTRPHGTQRPGK